MLLVAVDSDDRAVLDVEDDPLRTTQSRQNE